MKAVSPSFAMPPRLPQAQQRNGALLDNGEKIAFASVDHNRKAINALLTEVYPHSQTAPILGALETLLHDALNPQQTLLDVHIKGDTIDIRQEGQKAFSVPLPLNDIQIKKEGLTQKIRAITTRHLYSIMPDLASIVPDFKK
jgi:hypothetical protein